MYAVKKFFRFFSRAEDVDIGMTFGECFSDILAARFVEMPNILSKFAVKLFHTPLCHIGTGLAAIFQGSFHGAEKADDARISEIKHGVTSGNACGSCSVVIAVDNPFFVGKEFCVNTIKFLAGDMRPIFAPPNLIQMVKGEVGFLGKFFGECAFSRTGRADHNDFFYVLSPSFCVISLHFSIKKMFRQEVLQDMLYMDEKIPTFVGTFSLFDKIHGRNLAGRVICRKDALLNGGFQCCADKGIEQGGICNTRKLFFQMRHGLLGENGFDCL